MKVVRQAAEIPLHVDVGFVPTMGALHEGHLHLMRTAKQECDFVVASIFVNPLQFGPGEDFEKYPRNEERDLQLAEAAGVDLMFIPDMRDILADQQVTIKVGALGERWEGRRRPGHFDGVATIVAKLFNMVQPSYAYFGLKDFQQCAVIGALIRDLNFKIELRLIETVREKDGLAMSSRNAYLSPEHRRIAVEIFETLTSASERMKTEPPPVVLSQSVQHLSGLGFAVDYFAMIDGTSLDPIEELGGSARLICAAKLGSTWLIDNAGL